MAGSGEENGFRMANLPLTAGWAFSSDAATDRSTPRMGSAARPEVPVLMSPSGVRAARPCSLAARSVRRHRPLQETDELTRPDQGDPGGPPDHGPAAACCRGTAL